MTSMTDLPDDDELEITRCEQFGHTDEYLIDDDEVGWTMGCRACGAEWWGDYDEG